MENRVPNIITIMTDQHRFDALSCMGNKVLHTPNLDRLASKGVMFTNATCTYPLCGPSRAALLSGMYTHGHKFRGNAEVYEDGMSEQVHTIDEILNENDYHTVYFGKWHTGSANRGCYQGGLGYFLSEYREYLDEKYPATACTSCQKEDRYTHREYDSITLDDMMQNAVNNGMFMPHHNEAGKTMVAPEDTLTAWTAQKLISFIKHTPSKPFAATCSILHPHAPLLAAEPYYSMFDAAKMPMPVNVMDDCNYNVKMPVPDIIPLEAEGLGRYISLYYGLIAEVDYWVGKILDELDKSGLANNTLVIFTSDHGELMGSHCSISKMTPFEESIRVPLIISFPGVIAKNKKVDIPVTGADIMPTILSFAGIDIPKSIHGESVKRFITGESNDYKEFAYCEFNNQRIIRSPEWKLVLNPKGQSHINDRCMLYHLSSDAGEQHNLISNANRSIRNLKVAEYLKKELINLMEDIGVCKKEIDIYDNFSFS